jgi:serine/threonine protein kinase
VLAAGYVVVDHLRRGHRLDVYDVWSDVRHCRCIAKTLRPERSLDVDAATKLCNEGKVLAGLAHPHLVRAYETVQCTGTPRPAVILEMLPGVTLAYLVDDHGRLPVGDVAILGVQLASALTYLHRHRWLHLDVKPSNIVATGGRAILLDLSLAARPGSITRGGTYDYLSPEQAVGGRATPATDVWGLGATLYEALTGVTPFEGVGAEESTSTGSGTSDTMDGRRRAGFRPPSLRVRGSFPPRVVEVVDACLAPAPADRPALGELSDTLAGLAGADPRR